MACFKKWLSYFLTNPYGIDNVILQRHTGDYVLGRIRAGLLEVSADKLLDEVCAGHRAHVEGFVWRSSFTSHPAPVRWRCISRRIRSVCASKTDVLPQQQDAGVRLPQAQSGRPGANASDRWLPVDRSRGQPVPSRAALSRSCAVARGHRGAGGPSPISPSSPRPCIRHERRGPSTPAPASASPLRGSAGRRAIATGPPTYICSGCAGGCSIR